MLSMVPISAMHPCPNLWKTALFQHPLLSSPILEYYRDALPFTYDSQGILVMCQYLRRLVPEPPSIFKSEHALVSCIKNGMVFAYHISTASRILDL